MTEQQFLTECNDRLIDPALALENEDIHAALANRKDSKVIKLLDTEF